MKLSKRDREAFAALDALYAQLPTIVCQRKCTIACSAIPLTDLEARRLQLEAHRKPRTIPVTLVPRGEVRAREVERCIYLEQERTCGVYAVRPLICRVWGLVKMLCCPHGCLPDRWLSDLEFLAIAQAVERIGGGRVVRTARDGLTYHQGEAFGQVQPQRAVVDIEADAERTRTLRAIHGGRITRVVTNAR